VSDEFDIVVIGGGPAGLAAAIQARELGLTAALLDEQREPGGQIYRAVERSEIEGRAAKLGEDYRYGLALTAAFRNCGAAYLAGRQVWQVERDGRVYLTDGAASTVIRGRRVVVAVGAMERPVPIRGWTLPGVMTVGSAQILLKTISLLPGPDVWLAGSGPLMLAYAAQVVASGGHLAGILDTSRNAQRRAALAHWRGALRGWRDIAKGLRYYRALRAAGVRIVRNVDAVEAHGNSQLTHVRWRTGTEWQAAPAAGLLLHEGVIPNTQITQSLGCTHAWDAQQHCFRPVVDAFGATDASAIFVAGDCGGIGGARAAEQSGRLAAIGVHAALCGMSAAERESLAAPMRRQLQAHLAIRGFLDALFPPAPALLAPADPVVVCRCEGVTAGRIREAVALGCRGPNQVKSFTRCGMGPCQGRMCGSTVTSTIAAALDADPQKVGGFRVRPPLKPLRLGELASLAQPASAA
jgi:NADPH-dependent 2,4-dienoyl-CoA reductase/sulfur reductase-like enzyme